MRYAPARRDADVDGIWAITGEGNGDVSSAISLCLSCSRAGDDAAVPVAVALAGDVVACSNDSDRVGLIRGLAPTACVVSSCPYRLCE